MQKATVELQAPIICGLKARPELNGVPLYSLGSFDFSKQRYEALTQQHGLIRIKHDNLDFGSAAAELFFVVGWLDNIETGCDVQEVLRAAGCPTFLDTLRAKITRTVPTAVNAVIKYSTVDPGRPWIKRADMDATTVLMKSVTMMRPLPVITALLQAGARTDAPGDLADGITPLMEAVTRINLLLHGSHAVHFQRSAIAEGQIRKHIHNTVQALLDAGADTEACESDGYQAIHLAHQDLELVKVLLKGGANLEATQKFGNTVLMEAAGGGVSDVVSGLVSLGANLHATDQKGLTALHWACDNGHVKTA